MRVMFTGFSPPRHPLARGALALAGIVVLGLFSAVALVVVAGAVLALTGRSMWQRLKGESNASAQRGNEPNVIEGEFEIVRPERLTRSR